MISYTNIGPKKSLTACTIIELINNLIPNFLFSLLCSSYLGDFIRMLTNTKSSVKRILNVFEPPKEIAVPVNTSILTIPIGMQFARTATKIAIPKGAKSLFTPKLTKESKKEIVYRIIIFILNHFFMISFIPDLFILTSSLGF